MPWLHGLCAPEVHAKTVKISMDAVETEVVIDNRGTKYAAWTYDGMIPGKVVRITIGDSIDSTFKPPHDYKT